MILENKKLEEHAENKSEYNQRNKRNYQNWKQTLKG